MGNRDLFENEGYIQGYSPRDRQMQEERAATVEISRNGVVIGRWKSHTNLTHPGKYFRPSKVKIMRPTSPK